MPPVALVLDFSRPPTPKLLAALARRADRLGRMAPSIEGAIKSFSDVAGELLAPVRVRRGFAYLASAPAGGPGSDRVLPKSERRPPASRLMSPRGSALRLELTALAYQQARHRRGGARADSALPIRPALNDSGDKLGWSDLIASPSSVHMKGLNYISVQDKKVRQVQQALTRMAKTGLVDLPSSPSGRSDFDRFMLLDETGDHGSAGDSVPYTVPRAKEPCFELPASFFRNGWVHVLEDSEILLLLMVACGVGSITSPPDVAVPSDVRLLRYGIGRASYTPAHTMLSKLGLLAVQEIGRRDDGRVFDYGTEDGEAHVHRLRLLPAGFEKPAMATISATIAHERERGR